MAVHRLDEEFIHKYRISSFFAPEKRGGQKTVYFPVIDEQKIAMKLFHIRGDVRNTRELEFHEKFKDLDGIPKVMRVDNYEGDIIVFEEFIEGENLADISSIFSNEDVKVKHLIKDLIQILTPIWTHRYVHRDIKPSNIIIQASGRPVLLDFGIVRSLEEASITDSHFQPHSPLYGSPEQYAGQKELISYRTDFFSLGVLAYYLYHGHYPFGSSKEEIARKFQDKVSALSFDQDCILFDFCRETLCLSPSERPRNVDKLLELLTKHE